MSQVTSTTHEKNAFPPPRPPFLKGLLGSVRWQLTFTFILLLLVSLILVNILVDLTNLVSTWLLLAGSLAIFVVGSLTAFLFTTLLLRPLTNIKDASQAIAFGDLEQRVRLRKEQNGEIGELASNIDKLVDQVERAHHAQKTSDERSRRFISDASHELRTPLTSLRGFTEVLMRGSKDDPETLQRVLRMMKRESERMTRLVNDMLTLARLDDGKLVKLQKVDVLEIGIESLERAKLMAQDNRNISLKVAPDERFEVLADPDRLKEVLHILLDNAIKYGKQGSDGRVVLRLDRQAENVLIQVVDNGRGLSADDLNRVFERFYRGNTIPLNAEGAPIGGAGLGLAIARAIVINHKGTIYARSEPDTATVFTVSLPASR